MAKFNTAPFSINFPDMGISYFAQYDLGDEIWNLYDEPGGELLGSSETCQGLRDIAQDLFEELMG